MLAIPFTSNREAAMLGEFAVCVRSGVDVDVDNSSNLVFDDDTSRHLVINLLFLQERLCARLSNSGHGG